MTQCAGLCPFKTANGWCGLSACIRRNTTTEISQNVVAVIPEGYVKVIRCRDCEHYYAEKGECTRHEVRGPDGEIDFSFYVEPNDYCSDGERRLPYGSE